MVSCKFSLKPIQSMWNPLFPKTDRLANAWCWQESTHFLQTIEVNYPLVMTNSSPWYIGGPFIDGLRIKNCDFPWLY